MSMTLILILTVALGGGQRSDQSLQEVLRDFVIVRARVVEELEANDDDSFIHRVTVTHLYCGEIETEDLDFKMYSMDFTNYTGGGFSGGTPLNPPLRLGEEMFMLLRERDGVLLSSNDNRLRISWPVRATGRSGANFGSIPIVRKAQEPNAPNPQYPRVQQMAEALETVWNEKTESERIILLKEYATGEMSELAVAAVALLAAGAQDALKEIAADIEANRLPLRAELVLDKAMIKLEKESWIDSEQRQACLRRWVLATRNEADRYWVVNRLYYVANYKQIEPERLMELVTSIFSEAYPEEVKRYAINLIGSIVNDPDTKDRAVALLARILLSDEAFGLKSSAVETLRSLNEVEPNQLANLLMLQNYYTVLALDAKAENREHVEWIAIELSEIVRNLSDSKPTQPPERES